MNLKFLITRTIYETPAISQRSLAKKFFVSLGKINSVLNEVIDDGLIKKSSKEGIYEITSKGEEMLNANKVDGAIILACGRGFKFRYDDEEAPTCFLEINGEKLIERQIKQLKGANIDDITVMIGFMKEKFDYLIDKYNVKLIYNDEYKYKKTLSTFYHAKEILKSKNMYICVSDVYAENNIYHQYEIEPYLIGQFYEDCKNEWRLVANSKSEIKEVIVGGTNDFCAMGISFLSKSFLDEFIPLVEEYYNKSFTDDYYWENVLVSNFLKLPKIYLYKLGMGEISEFDTTKDIEEFNKNDSNINENIIEYVSKSMEVDKKNIHSIECIKEDVANLIYRFNVNDEKYTIRLPKENANEFIDRKNEKEIIEKILKNNRSNNSKKVIVPIEEVVYFDELNAYKISKYIDGGRPIDINSEKEIKKSLEAYKKLHTCDVKVSGSCDIIDMIYKYLDIIRSKNMTVPYEDFDEVLDKAKVIKEYIDNVKRVKVVCHGAPNPNNILYAKGEVILIDFEYGGMADPISDIALFATFLKMDIDKAYNLYEIYKSIEITDENIINFLPDDDKLAEKLFVAYMALGGFYNALWSIVRGSTSGADYGTIGMDGYRTFKNCYKKFN